MADGWEELLHEALNAAGILNFPLSAPPDAELPNCVWQEQQIEEAASAFEGQIHNPVIEVRFRAQELMQARDLRMTAEAALRRTFGIAPQSVRAELHAQIGVSVEIATYRLQLR